MISVVIITKNEGHIIGKTLERVKNFTDDIVIGDSGSTDNTLAIAKQYGANILQFQWPGFGIAKNNVVAAAKHNWVLALDADEVPKIELLEELKQLDLQKSNQLFIIKFENYIGNKIIKYGDWANVKKVRLFNKQHTLWENKPVHENVIRHDDSIIITLKNKLEHYCHTNILEYAQKMTFYGQEMANRYFSENKRPSFFKLYIYPFFYFILNYIFKLGFLDGGIGLVAAYLSSYYVFIKYHHLHTLQQQKNNTL